MTERNLMTTLDEGRTSTWRLPLRSALTMLLRASFYYTSNNHPQNNVSHPYPSPQRGHVGDAMVDETYENGNANHGGL